MKTPSGGLWTGSRGKTRVSHDTVSRSYVSLTLLRRTTQHARERRGGTPDGLQSGVVLLTSLESRQAVGVIALNGVDGLHVFIEAPDIFARDVGKLRVHPDRLRDSAVDLVPQPDEPSNRSARGRDGRRVMSLESGPGGQGLGLLAPRVCRQREPPTGLLSECSCSRRDVWRWPGCSSRAGLERGSGSEVGGNRTPSWQT